MRIKLSFFAVIACLFMSSCATVFTGTKDSISFKTTPSGATVQINGIDECKTPCSVRVKRSMGDTQADFQLENYDTRSIELNKEFNVISVVNLGNLLGWGIDALSGAIMKYDKKNYDIELTKSTRK